MKSLTRIARTWIERAAHTDKVTRAVFWVADILSYFTVDLVETQVQDIVGRQYAEICSTQPTQLQNVTNRRPSSCPPLYHPFAVIG